LGALTSKVGQARSFNLPETQYTIVSSCILT
jgi:hypothetical protein